MEVVNANQQYAGYSDAVDKIITFYNTKSGAHIPVNEDSRDVVITCLKRMSGDPILIKNHIRRWTREHRKEEDITSYDGFEECFETIEVPSSTPVYTEQSVNSSIGILGDAVAKVVLETQKEQIAEQLKDTLHKEIKDFIYQEYGPIQRKITTVVNGVSHDTYGLQHEKFNTVLQFVANDEPVFLSGPAGSGKNFICKQVADALGLRFYFSNAVTQEYKLTGFTDAMGNYQPTQFYKAFTEGGLFMLDEIDASIPEVLVILNAAIANRYFDFPAPIGYKEAHPDFRVVAAGNTTGHGADYDYVGRNQLDGASLDRFAIVEVDYSPLIENGLASDIKLADFCREFRQASKKTGVNIIVSYRAIDRLSKMSKVISLEEALKTCLVKDLGKDDLNIIINELTSTTYSESLKHIAEAMGGNT